MPSTAQGITVEGAGRADDSGALGVLHRRVAPSAVKG